MTAYELRISDWSSDVCSSDLLVPLVPAQQAQRPGASPSSLIQNTLLATNAVMAEFHRVVALGETNSTCGRSEEHTSELQSLMRISYAVFCLKKKKHVHRLTLHK